MAYIGRPSIVGNFVKLDAISVVNGQAAYTMQNSSANFTDYSSVNQFMVSLNSVIQSPGSSFTVSGSTITFASNLVTNDVIDFIIVFGNSLSSGVPTDATVSTAKLADNAVTAAKITDSTITAAKLASGTVQNQSAFKNIIINGDMSQAQRSTSVSSITSSSYNTVDRFRTTISTAGTWTQSQSTDVPTGQGFAKSLKMDCTTADGSLAAGDRLFIEQQVEGQNLQYLKKGTSSAESTTMSFWVKSNKTGTYICVLEDDNSRSISKSYTISSADTWEKKTITFAGDTSGALDNDNTSGFRVEFWLAAGSTYSSGTLATDWGSTTNANIAVGQVNLADSTSNEWYVTGVQFEVGTAASDFEFLPYDVNLKRCQRYYYKKISANAYGPLAQGMQIGASHQMVQGYHPVTMRSAPSLTQSGWSYEAGTGSGTWSISSSRTNIDAWGAEKTGVSNSEGSAIIIYAENNAAAYFTADSEL